MPGRRLIVVSERDHYYLDVEDRTQYRLGRAPDNEIVVKDDMASRRHCVVERDATGELRVRDLKSFNGTFINERRIREERLGLWDALRVGRTRLFLVERGEGSPPAPVAGAAAAPAAAAPSAPPPAAAPAAPAGVPVEGLGMTQPMRLGGPTPEGQLAELLAQKETRALIEDIIRREREEVEREICRRVRDESAPPAMPALEGLDVRARRSGPLDGGGDFYDAFVDPKHANHVLVAVGSVSGVGLPACVAAAAARHTLRGVASGREDDVKLVLDLAREVLHHTLHPGSAASVLLARVQAGGRAQVCACGGTGVLYFNSATDTVEVLRPPGRRDEEAPRVETFEVNLRAGDRLVLASDGAGSLRRTDGGDPYGSERLRGAVAGASGVPPKELVAKLGDDFAEYAQKAPDRDVTVAIVALAK